MKAAMGLEQELEFFEANRERLLKEHAGKFALVKGAVLVDTFDTAENAYVAALEKFGNVPVLIKPILAEDPIIQVPVVSLGLLPLAHP